MSKPNTRAIIDANIKQNGQQLITGQVLNATLNAMVTDYAEQAALDGLKEKVDALALGAFYGYFLDSDSLPTDVTTPGYAYVGSDNPYEIWNFNGESWSDSGTSIDMNDADEEDITRNADGKLQFKDRSYGDGMGYVILRKDKTFAEQVTDTNTIYEIRYNFDLDGESVSIPVGCELRFNGGRLINGELVVAGTLLSGCKSDILDGVYFNGWLQNKDLYASWFGCHSSLVDASSKLTYFLNCYSAGDTLKNRKTRYILDETDYYISNTIVIGNVNGTKVTGAGAYSNIVGKLSSMQSSRPTIHCSDHINMFRVCRRGTNFINIGFSYDTTERNSSDVAILYKMTNDESVSNSRYSSVDSSAEGCYFTNCQSCFEVWGNNVYIDGCGVYDSVDFMSLHYYPNIEDTTGWGATTRFFGIRGCKAQSCPGTFTWINSTSCPFEIPCVILSNNSANTTAILAKGQFNRSQFIGNQISSSKSASPLMVGGYRDCTISNNTKVVDASYSNGIIATYLIDCLVSGNHMNGIFGCFIQAETMQNVSVLNNSIRMRINQNPLGANENYASPTNYIDNDPNMHCFVYVGTSANKAQTNNVTIAANSFVQSPVGGNYVIGGFVDDPSTILEGNNNVMGVSPGRRNLVNGGSWDVLVEKELSDVFVAYHSSISEVRFVPLLKWKDIESSDIKADGVALFINEKPVVIATKEANLPFASSSPIPAENPKDIGGAITDFDGKSNTSAIIANSTSECITNTSSYAAGYCNLYTSNHVRSDGRTYGFAPGRWWLPSFGEIFAIYRKKERVNFALSFISGASPLSSARNYMTSNYSSATLVWTLNIRSLPVLFGSTGAPTGSSYVRPITTL